MVMANINLPLEVAPLVTNTEPALAPGPEPITGKLVRLERFSESHIPDLWETVGQHSDVWTWWPEGPFTKEEFVENMKGFMTFRKEDLAVYSVILLSGPEKEKPVGLAMALSEKRDSNRVAELGALFGPLLQRTRAATEALYLCGDMMFRLNHRRMSWHTNALNLASRKAAERYGFVYEGTMRQHAIQQGRNRDTVTYSIIDSEWPVCKETFEKWLDDGNFDEQGLQRSRLEDIRETLKQK